MASFPNACQEKFSEMYGKFHNTLVLTDFHERQPARKWLFLLRYDVYYYFVNEVKGSYAEESV
jgi:hypothetical protein